MGDFVETIGNQTARLGADEYIRNMLIQALVPTRRAA